MISRASSIPSVKPAVKSFFPLREISIALIYSLDSQRHISVLHGIVDSTVKPPRPIPDNVSRNRAATKNSQLKNRPISPLRFTAWYAWHTD
jgi:hypothetical protein